MRPATPALQMSDIQREMLEVLARSQTVPLYLDPPEQAVVLCIARGRVALGNVNQN